jgi:D-3-phosphoglycerate dehydrogenase
MPSDVGSKRTVVITDSDFGDDSIEREVLGSDFSLRQADALDPAAVVTAAAGAAGLLVQWARITAEVFEALDSLEIVVRYGIGLDNIDLEAARAHGVEVRNVDDYCIDEVADHTAAAVRSAGRRLTAYDRCVKEGAWGPHLVSPPLPPGEDPVGVAGFGRIGSAVSSRLIAAGHPVLVWDPPAEERAGEAGIETAATLAQLAERVNHLCLHIPSSPQTAGIVDREILERLGPSGHLVNSARGQLIVESDLLAWLERHPAASASLDVFATEPPAGESAIVAHHPQVLATPHVAYLSTASLPRLRRTAATHVREALIGTAEGG